jgi:pimeloyl-ACP methyl ester carboxylesterase
MLNSLFLPGQPNSVSSVRDVLSSYGAAADSADLNERLALRHSGAAELLCAQWASSSSPAYVPAHFVAVDLHLRALVVSVRGTGHPLDVAADLQIWPERYGVRGRAHAGMAAAARGLRDALLPRLRGWLAEPRFDRFRLVVVGHSLGGGTAALLALELASALRPTRVRALAFATPAVLDRASARAAAEVVTSFVGGADLVPTLCVGSLRALGRACRAAYTALQAHGFAALAERAQAQFAGGFGLAQQARGNWTGQHELGGVLRDSAFRRDLKRAMAAAASNRTKGARGGRGRDSTLAVRASTGEAADDDDDVLYPAGLICHLQSRPPGPPPGPACESRAVERESFGVVRISPQAFVDHLPARYEQLLDMCAPGDVVPTVESAATVFT